MRKVLLLGFGALFAWACSDDGSAGRDGGVADGGARDASGDTRMDGASSDGASHDAAPTDAQPADVAPRTQRFACMDCPSTVFPEPSATACANAPASRPTLIYPPDGVLLPPNLNVIEVQFMPGAGNTLWEIDFTNAQTDVRVVTRCNAITSVRGRATGACGFTLAQDVWDAMVAPNRGRLPVVVTVRGTTTTADCTATAAVTRQLFFGEEDIQGGIYYWQSAVFGGTAGRTGGIYLHDFGNRDPAPTPFLESGTSGRCTGCHNLSRDGERISFGQDDPDADDEFADVSTAIQRVADHSVVPTLTRPSPGFQAFNHDHTRMIASAYTGSTAGANLQFALFDGNTGTRVSTVPLPAPGTQPDWSADDRRIVYVQPRTGTISNRGDHHFHGGDLYTMDVSAAGAFGTARLLLPHNLMGEAVTADSANYYPSFSPDGQFLLFNHATSGDIFYNRTAQVYLATADGMNVYPLDRLNAGPNLTNSWPRWSPFVQRYITGHILWVTFSSNRNYGVRVENDAPLRNCYPPASPTEDTPQTTDWTMCTQPQLWMAAVRVDTDEFGSGRDTSWPAFWLPFQSINSHNHSAQWVTRVVNRTCVEAGGTCPGAGGAGCCDTLMCDGTSHTCVPACIPEGGTCPGPHGEGCCNGIPCDNITMSCQRPPG